MIYTCEVCGRSLSDHTEGALVVTERAVARSPEHPEIRVTDEVVRVWCPLCRHLATTTREERENRTS